MASENQDNTKTDKAKLIRGGTYTYRNQRFIKGEEVPVTPQLADELEALMKTSRDSRDGDVIEKPRFKITRGANSEELDNDPSNAKIVRRGVRKPSRATAS